MSTLVRRGGHSWLRRLSGWLPVPVVIATAIVAQWGLLESRYDVGGHAGEHLTSASAPFLAAALVVLIVWATPHTLAHLDVFAVAGLWFASTVLVMVGNLRVIDDLVHAGLSHTPTSAVPDIADHELANLAPWYAVLIALALLAICRRRRLIGTRTTIGAAAASALVPPWISPGAIGVVVLTAAIVWRRRTGGGESASPQRCLSSGHRHRDAMEARPPIDLDGIVQRDASAGHRCFRAVGVERSCSPAMCRYGELASTCDHRRACREALVGSAAVRIGAPRLVLVIVLAASAATSCSDDSRATPRATTTATTSSATTAPTIAMLPSSRRGLVWSTCSEPGLIRGQCATLEVPIDYRDPAGATLAMFVYRERAEGDRRGTLIVNPGGPGASAVDFVRDRSGSFPRGFDVIGFDPRGVGRSHPVDCVGQDEIDAAFGGPLRPADSAELDDSLARAELTARRCLATDVGPHVGTVNVARDLDRLRLALGDETITYLGFSYGARLGWTYDAMYPGHVRAMVLDGPEDPDADIAATLVAQAVEFEHLANVFNDSCPRFNVTVCPDDIRAAASEIVERAERSPIPTRTGSPDLSAQYAINAVLSAFYDSNTWPDLTEALRAAQTFDGAPLARLSYWWNENQDPRPGGALDVVELIWCADHADRPSVRDYTTITQQVAAVSPTFAEWYPGVTPRCYGHPPAAEPTPPPAGTTSTPILVVASTADFATPLAGAEDLVARLPGAVLLTRDGSGHTSYDQGIRCVDQHVDRFLTDIVRPPAHAVCR